MAVKKPDEVEVVNKEPLHVEVEEAGPRTHTNVQGHTIVTPTTTEEEDRTTQGQRYINLIWEVTQAVIAVSITLSVVYTAITEIDSLNLTNAFFLIIGFYFSRTNHQAIGGVGKKYLGR